MVTSIMEDLNLKSLLDEGLKGYERFLYAKYNGPPGIFPKRFSLLQVKEYETEL